MARRRDRSQSTAVLDRSEHPQRTRGTRNRPLALVAASRRIFAAERRKLAENAGASGVGDVDDGELWLFYDWIPEVKFAARFVGNSLSRIRYYPALIVSKDEPPVALADLAALAADPASRPADYDESIVQLAADAEDELERLGDLADLLYGFGLNLTVPGDCWLVGRPDTESDALVDEIERFLDDPDGDGPEVWEVYAPDAVKFSDEGTKLYDKPGKVARVIANDDDDVVFVRIWRRHPRWRGQADSNLRAVRSECRELMALSRLFRAVTNSRTMGGILKLPNGLDQKSLAPTLVEDPDNPGEMIVEGSTEEDDLTPLERSILDSYSVAAAEHDAPEAVAPVLLRGAREDLFPGGSLYESLERKIDDQMIGRVDHLVGRLAHGVDLPREVLLGMADANHWSGWQIEDSTYKAHLEPTAQVPARAIAKDILRPALIARIRGGGENPAPYSEDLVARVVVALDPSDLVVRPNRAQDAKDAFDKWAIGHSALRRHLGIPDGDAPSTEELVLRLLVTVGPNQPQLLRALFRALPGLADLEIPDEVAPGFGGGAPASDSSSDEDGGEGGGDPIPAQDEGQAAILAAGILTTLETTRRSGPHVIGPETARSALLAAAAGYEVRRLGERLAAIDARLVERIASYASAEMTQVLRRAGNRLRTRVQGTGDDALRARVKGLEPEDVPAVLLEAGIVSAADLDRQVRDGWDRVEVTYRESVRAARREALSAISSTLPADIAPDEDDEGDLALNRDDENAGWAALLAGLVAAAASRLGTSGPTEVLGESTTGIDVSFSVVRQAISIAGGGRPGSGIEARAYGVAYSPQTRQFVGDLGITTTSYEWTVGTPTRPFEPHQDLEGIRFSSWDDEQLAADPSQFPYVESYAPGDHDGCQCAAVPILELGPSE